jgi:hypothetical protein
MLFDWLTALVSPWPPKEGNDPHGGGGVQLLAKPEYEADSLPAAQKLENKTVTSDRFFVERDDCISAYVNTTIVSLCNGNARFRTINRAEGMFCFAP